MNTWKIERNKFIPECNLTEESLFTVANGYLGMRGNQEEPVGETHAKCGTYINGFFEESTIPYGEVAYGYAKHTQTMLNVADAKEIRLMVGKELFSPVTCEMTDYCRSLNLQEGVLERRLIWQTEAGGRVRIVSDRLCSMTQKQIAVVTYAVTALDGDVSILLSSGINGNTQTGEESDDPRIAGGLGDGAYGVSSVRALDSQQGRLLSIGQRTKNSGRSVYCFVAHQVFLDQNETFQDDRLWNLETIQTEDSITEKWEVSLKKGETLKLVKYICYSAQSGGGETLQEKEVWETGLTQIEQAVKIGAKQLRRQQRTYFREFWDRADVNIIGNEKMTASMRFNLFHLLQAVGKDSTCSIAAKGLSGEGYGGHYFWESEAYIMPVFLYSEPEIARQMLIYRYHILDKAREQARLLGHERGALYSWRSITGEECSAFFLGGSSQYHISADVAFGVHRYLDATQDDAFLRDYAVEILIETARLWISVGHYNERKDGKFCIDGVTGPDEYTAMVNNNFYTNVMARENLRNAVRYAAQMKQKFPEEYRALCERISLEPWEMNAFQEAADRMYIPYDEKLQIHKQDDNFLDKKILDLSRIPEENHPLLTHYHPLFIYRHQVCKQADLILAEYYLPQYFDREERRRDYEYYEKITTHDSSLSACVFSIMAADNGDIKKAYRYFVQTVRTDLDDNQHNTKDGLHMANMAGAWLCVVNGFAGMKTENGVLSFSPVLPEEWEGYQFSVCYRGKRLQVTVSREGVLYELGSEADEMQILHYNAKLHLKMGSNRATLTKK